MYIVTLNFLSNAKSIKKKFVDTKREFDKIFYHMIQQHVLCMLETIHVQVYYNNKYFMDIR